jgi:hypothetical protein
MALLTKPASLHLRQVNPSYIKAKSRNVSPFTFDSQVYTWPGERWTFDVESSPVKDPTNAKAIAAFLRDLAKADNYVQIDMSAYMPADVSQPMSLRIAGNVAHWEIDVAKVYTFSFKLEENK